MRGAGGVAAVLLMGTLVCAGTSGCVPRAELGETGLTGESFLVVEVQKDFGQASVRARGYSGALPERLVIPSDLGSASELHVLAYDAALLDLGFDVGPDGEVLFAPEDAPPSLTRAIPIAPRWVVYDIAAETREQGGPGLPPFLASLALLRPACRAVRVEKRLLDLPAGVASFWPWGPEGVLIGRDADERREIRPAVLVLDSGRDDPRLLAPPSVFTSSEPFALPPMFYTEGSQIRMTWGSDDRPGHSYSFAVTSTLGFTDRRELIFEDGSALRPAAIAAFVDGSTRTVAVVHDGWDEANQRPAFHLSVQHEVGARFTSALVSIEDASDCRIGTYTQVFELSGPSQGLVGFKRESIRRFDLTASPVAGEGYGPPEAARVCRSARTVMDGGDEALTWKEPPQPNGSSLPRGGIAWRRAGGQGWLPVEGQERPTGAAIASQGDLLFVALESQLVGVFERDPRRPDEAPRHCGDLPVQTDVQKMIVRPHGVLVGGTTGNVTWLATD